MVHKLLSLAVLTCSIVLTKSTPTFTPSSISAHFLEQFTGDWSERWSPSRAVKDDVAGEKFSYVGEWSVEEPRVYPAISGDEGLTMKTKAAHHAISVPFDTPLDTDGKTLVVQYEVKLQKGLECGGAYIKLLTDSDIGIQAEEFSDKTPYTIMFGPDRCGSTAKVHFIFRHANPITGEVEEKHLTAPPPPKTNLVTTLYTLIVRPDQTFEIKVNDESVKTGSLLLDFSPSVNPSEMIDDASEVKPADWVESPKITDPEAVKPEDWDEDAPQYIEDMDAVQPEDWLVDESAMMPDPEAEKPEEWSDEDDGDWIAPSVSNPLCEAASGCGEWVRPEITNPEYKGKWFAPLIDNPEYKGVWAPKQIKNPDYFEDLNPAKFNKMAGLGIELWTMTEDIMFNNIYIGHSEEDASTFAAETFHIKKPIEDAQEDAAAPVTPPTPKDTSLVPDMKTEPVEFIKFKLQEFIDVAILDPVGAFKALPYTGAAVGALFTAVVGLLAIFLASLLPGSAPAPKKVAAKKTTTTTAAVSKKTDAVTADDDDDDEEVVVVATPVVVEESKEESGPKTRAGKGKAAAAAQ